MYQVMQYILFWFRSSNQHGVHSPFVYNLITTCFYDKTEYEDYKTIKAFRKRLTSNELVILVQDFGAGSRIFRSNARQIHKVAKTAGIPEKRAQLLFRLVRYFKSEHILELGTSLGLATSAMSLSQPNSKIYTIEGCKETAEIAQEQFDFFKLKNINLLQSQFNHALDTKPVKDNVFDLIYVDGNHEKKATLDYFKTLLSHTSNETIMIFDDIHWSKGMQEAWQEIKNHPKVKVTVDTFFWGIISFRKEQEKEHFIIRV